MQYTQSSSAFQLLLVAATVCALTLAPLRASAAYDFAYGVNDPGSGDVKDQQETRDGDQVTGYYRLLDADGLIRTVNYASNPRTGFQARVTRERAEQSYSGAAAEQRSAYATGEATSYQQHTRPMSGYRYDTVHPGQGYRAAAGSPIIGAYGDSGLPAGY